MKQKTHIAEYVIIKRMSDIEYITYLENSIRDIDSNINQFITLMDNAVFSKQFITLTDNAIFSKKVTDRPMEALQVYVDNIQLLQKLNKRETNGTKRIS